MLVRDDASELFPAIWEDTVGRSEYHRKLRTVYFAMTDGESAIVDAVRRGLLARGCRADAVTGDGVLATPSGDFGPRVSLTTTLRELEETVAKETGYKVVLSGKTLDGVDTSQWCDSAR